MTDRLTPEREAEIEQRADAATPGPWGSYRDFNAVYTIQARPRTTRNGMENDGDIATLATGRSDAESYANARFITHAREDVRALLAELSVVRAERDSAHAEVEQLRSSRWDATKVVADLESRLHATHTELADVLRVLARLANPEPCRWEGVYCITHSWRSDTGSCPHGEAQQLLGGAA
ncbi:hypothetical protein OOK48_35300 [Streptomyces viridodiastaticus]|uniref:hypothetical protein n=1 Tax=Streptomyces albogriseolus TaxID=1887 RepID=UPI002252B780|nr:hypothetical protein [Streptomyces viridodiastaticus]MCX4571589.1 hypothetical protein [Streptomyces viridodiastaticus]